MALLDNAILRIVASLAFPESVIAQNVFYAIVRDTGTSMDEDDIVDDLSTWLQAAYTELDSYIDSSVAFTDIRVYVYDPVDEDWDEVGSVIVNLGFSGGAEMLPHGVAYLSHAKTVDPDVQAGKYIGGFTEGSQADGLWLSAVNAVMANFSSEWVAPFVGVITGNDFDPGVWSVARVAFVLFNENIALNTIPAYQRRRKPGVGI